MAEEEAAVVKEERSRLILAAELFAQVKEVHRVDAKISELNEEIGDVQEKLRILNGRKARLVGERDEYLGIFWQGARQEHREWFRKMNEQNMCIHKDDIKDDNGEVIGVKVVAHNPAEDQVMRIRNIFQHGQEAEGPSGDE